MTAELQLALPNLTILTSLLEDEVPADIMKTFERV